MKSAKSTLLPVLFLAMLVLAGVVVFTSGRARLDSAGPVWRSLTPGVSTRAEVVNILGLPDKTEERAGVRVDVWQDHPDFGWRWVEVWFEWEGESSRVLGIHLMSPTDAGSVDSLQLMNLAQMYGKPDFIRWSTLRYGRFMAWTRRGLAIEGSVSQLSQTPSPDLSKFKTNQALLFIPQSVWSFTRFQWPWPAGAAWSSENLYRAGTTDAPDLFPKDPFDWRQALQQR